MALLGMQFKSVHLPVCGLLNDWVLRSRGCEPFQITIGKVRKVRNSLRLFCLWRNVPNKEDIFRLSSTHRYFLVSSFTLFFCKLPSSITSAFCTYIFWRLFSFHSLSLARLIKAKGRKFAIYFFFYNCIRQYTQHLNLAIFFKISSLFMVFGTLGHKYVLCWWRVESGTFDSDRKAWIWKCLKRCEQTYQIIIPK